jgi:hypothetical protein
MLWKNPVYDLKQQTALSLPINSVFSNIIQFNPFVNHTLQFSD